MVPVHVTHHSLPLSLAPLFVTDLEYSLPETCGVGLGWLRKQREVVLSEFHQLILHLLEGLTMRVDVTFLILQAGINLSFLNVKLV